MNARDSRMADDAAALGAQVEALIIAGDVDAAVACITDQQLSAQQADHLFTLAQHWAERGWLDAMWRVCDVLIGVMTQGHKLALVLAHRAQLYGDFAKVQHYAQRALALNLSDPYARQLLCQLLLWDTQFTQGLEHYEARFDAHGEFDAPDWRAFPAPRWAGEALDGKHLYLWTEQGVGDILQFAAFLPWLLAQHPGRVTFGTHAKLIPLLQRSFPAMVIERETRAFDHAVATMIHSNRVMQEALQRMGDATDSSAGKIDAAAPIGDLMVQYLPQWIPAQNQQAYLHADAARVAALKQTFTIAPGVRHIGISWHTANVQNGMVRSIPLALWKMMLAFPRCRFYSLQHDVDDAVLDDFCAENGCSIIRPDFDVKQDIEGLAAWMACMDEIITIDNSNVHLAGALGVPTTLLLPVGCNYRWPILANGGTLWYASVRVLRQQHVFDWESVMRRVAYDLGAVLA